MAKWVCLSLLLMLCVVPMVAAQSDCPALVNAALDSASEGCASLGRNQACYGNLSLQATPRADVPEFNFEQAGDIVDVADIDSLCLSAMSLTDETWGIALMRLQASLPDTLPGQNVTVLLFGDVHITNAVDERVELDVTASANANVRLRPTTTENNIISSLTVGQIVTANGRLQDTSWIRIVLDADTRELGWVSAEFLTSETDLETLAVVEVGAPLYGPMQVFYFGSGIGDRPCAEAPDSGILIQTPEGVGEVSLRVNEVDIRLGSTLYLQAGGGFMTISVVEGHAVLTAGGVSQTVPAGTFAQIPLDDNGLANGAPTFPQPYTDAGLRGLPLVITVILPEQIDVASPMRGDSNIEAAIDVANGLPPSGTWAFTRVVTQPGCGDNLRAVGETLNYDIFLTFNEDRSVVVMENGLFVAPLMRIGELTYQGGQDGDTQSITFTSPTTFEGENAQGSLSDPNPCIYHTHDSGVFAG